MKFITYESHNEMKQKASQLNEDEEIPLERDILMEVLCTRSGYE